eukprot:CAMPEP_0119036732 /NCGR_PEP_ID=MMETSP1177-20130426/4653_1 /TAXON_ID=2985 /ORGANISM="Ochromonas sp, Strain CCMP1899" /LENGTH=522 /DNA_ID=CAMNT_0006997015 /DNA_START=212 /DNA_END=1780 /DNA_ORIENTATION=-
MGDNGVPPSSRFFCHACGRVFGLGLGGIGSSDYFCCPHCQSSFLEEIDNPSLSPSADSSGVVVRTRNNALSEDQSRRLANAAIMLRLLELQLREELDSLQNAFATNNARRSDEIKVKPLTQIMLQKLRKTPLSLDMICSQPSCPVCNEDYHICGMITQLPCSHFFHDACLMPWLDAKKTCPICRYEITEAVPTVEELERFNIEELREKMKEMRDKIPISIDTTDDDGGNLAVTDKRSLAISLNKVLLDQKEAADTQSSTAAAVEEGSRLRRNIPLVVIGGSAAVGTIVDMNGPRNISMGERVRDMQPYEHGRVMFSGGAPVQEDNPGEEDLSRWVSIRREIERETERENDRQRDRLRESRERDIGEQARRQSDLARARMEVRHIDVNRLNDGNTSSYNVNNSILRGSEGSGFPTPVSVTVTSSSSSAPDPQRMRHNDSSAPDPQRIHNDGTIVNSNLPRDWNDHVYDMGIPNTHDPPPGYSPTGRGDSSPNTRTSVTPEPDPNAQSLVERFISERAYMSDLD